MKILFTGGGTGGHFYPIIAVAEAVDDLVRERKLLEPQLYYAAPDPYDRNLLTANAITFVPTAAGKMRRYFSPLNIIDSIKTGWGVIRAVVRVFFLYPDVVFSTGGYASFPTLLAAKLFRVPVIILNCDASPGRVSRWAGAFAEKVALAFAEGAEHFPKDKIAHTGNPIRKAALLPAREGAFEFLKLSHELPVLYITGGSQGAQVLNEVVLAALPQLLKHYQVIHQTGAENLADVEGRAQVVLANFLHKERYKPQGYLNDLATRMVAGAANLIIARAGAGIIFETAAWGLPAILVPIPEPTSHDQTTNAFAYARSGAAVVIEQNNLTPGLLVSEISRILDNPELARTMSAAARAFSRPNAAKVIANALLDIALSHEQ